MPQPLQCGIVWLSQPPRHPLNDKLPAYARRIGPMLREAPDSALGLFLSPPSIQDVIVSLVETQDLPDSAQILLLSAIGWISRR